MTLTRLLPLLLALMAVTAMTGSAAAVNNSVARLGASSDNVALCDQTFTVSRQTAYEPSLGEDEVTTVTVSGISGSACAGGTLKVVLANASRQVLGSQKTASVAASDTSKSLDFSGDNIADLDVASTHVVIVHP